MSEGDQEPRTSQPTLESAIGNGLARQETCWVVTSRPDDHVVRMAAFQYLDHLRLTDGDVLSSVCTPSNLAAKFNTGASGLGACQRRVATEGGDDPK